MAPYPVVHRPWPCLRPGQPAWYSARQERGTVPLCGNDRTALALRLDSREAAAVMQAAGPMLLEQRHQPKARRLRLRSPQGRPAPNAAFTERRHQPGS